MAYIQLDCQSIGASLTVDKGNGGFSECEGVCVGAREREREVMSLCVSALYMLDHGSIKAIRNVWGHKHRPQHRGLSH